MKPEVLQHGAYGKEVTAINRHLQLLLSPRLAALQLGFGQHMFLLMLSRKEGMNQKTLSEQLLLDKTTTAKAIRKLELEGYVRKEMDPADLRNHQLFLTDAGKAVVPKIEEALAEVMEIGIEGMSAEEYGEFMRLLKIVLNNFDKHAQSIRQHTE
ncbi:MULTISPECIES: MarR family winged helix-turn-helix transcriptional regulator [Paenibacillus]|uniref:Transcriptional regulator, MarR family n=2 Tax=Paenibacillus lactis TaxID=228574 RepID=G4HL21_9BACL|nr:MULTISPECIES: MarR family transcriptional regulator [Paenibacillus]EHB57475.1 transcriptional regulator, MarR family [Paenibacillus lactis 154]